MLKPQDIVVAFHLLQGSSLSQSEMAAQVGLSQPEISNALKRLKASRLLPTVTLAPPLLGKVAGEDMDLVWPAPRGTARANSLEPIHPCAVHAAQNNEQVYQLLVLVDGIRAGKSRIRSLSEELLAELVHSTGKHAARG